MAGATIALCLTGFGYACYVKIVDADEVTLSLVQEIYDDEEDRLIRIHRKYPKDTGHQVIEGEGTGHDYAE